MDFFSIIQYYGHAKRVKKINDTTTNNLPNVMVFCFGCLLYTDLSFFVSNVQNLSIRLYLVFFIIYAVMTVKVLPRGSPIYSSEAKIMFLIR